MQHFLGWNMATVFPTRSRSYTTVYNRPFSTITTSRWQGSKSWFPLTVSVLKGAGKDTVLPVSCHHRGGMKKGRKIRGRDHWVQSRASSISTDSAERLESVLALKKQNWWTQNFRTWIWIFTKCWRSHMHNCLTRTSPARRGGEGRWCQDPGLFQVLFILI